MLLKVTRISRNCYRWFYCSTNLQKRHSRPGQTSEVGLEELIIDKPLNQYPNLQDKLEKINYYDHPIRTKNIGLDEASQFYQNFLNQAGNILIMNQSEKNENDSDEDFDLDENKIYFLTKDEYELSSKYYPFTKQYVDSTIQLAHHYAIFRDLFFHEPFQNETCRDLIVANAKDQVKFHKLKHKELFQFYPLVPIDAEFIYQEKTNEEDAPNCLKSYRGNLIPAEYGQEPPIIHINTSGIIDKLKLSPEPSEKLVTLNSGQRNDPNYYTLCLVNLDSHFPDSGVCHWMISNIHNEGTNTTFETVVNYLPIYAIRGLGYHRYVFVLFQHEKPLKNLEKINDFDLGKRKFNGLQFMSDCSEKNQKTNLNPVGLSWFQTTWSDYCKDVFHNILDMRCPTYEYIFPKQQEKFEQLQYPGRAPFNLYLDAFRDPKDLSKEVLLERLKSINPMESYDTKKMYPTWEGRPRFPHIHPFPPNTPDWLKSTLLKKRSHIGRFRGLRAASAILPHNNNADLDKPRWPRINPDVLPLNVPNPYPDGKRRPKPFRDTLWSKPLPEHHSLRIDHANQLDDDDKEQYDKTTATSSTS